MNRRSLFKGLVAMAIGVPFAKAHASGGITGEVDPELHIPSANTGVVRAGGRTTIDLYNGALRFNVESRG